MRGAMPALLVAPMLGRMPTRELWLEGPVMELPVCVPRPIRPRLAEMPAPVPPLLPAEPVWGGTWGCQLRA